MLLSDKAKAAKRKYAAEWRKKNREKAKIYQERYWERRAEREDHADD